MEILLEFVTFNSAFHVAWFVLSVGLFLSCLFSVRRGKVTDGKLMATFMTLFHVLVAFEAAAFIGLGNEDRQVFSTHCIWFNLLMCLLYLRQRKRAILKLKTETDPF